MSERVVTDAEFLATLRAWTAREIRVVILEEMRAIRLMLDRPLASVQMGAPEAVSLPVPSPAAQAAVPELPPTSPPDRAQPGVRWSTARVNKMLELKRDGVPSRRITVAINTLPGETVTTKMVENWFTTQKVKARAFIEQRRAAPAPAAAQLASADGPRLADRVQIRDFVASKGWQIDPRDLDAVNEKCRSIGLSEFVPRGLPAR